MRRVRWLLIAALLAAMAFAAFELRQAFVVAARSPKGEVTPEGIVSGLGPSRWRGP